MANELVTLKHFLEARQSSLQSVLPKTLTPERVIKVALAAASRNPTLLKCTPESLYLSLHTASQLGLEAGGPLGAAYLVPFKNNKTGRYECTLIPGYRGLIDLARRSGQISTIYAYPVRKGDEFEWSLGLNPDIKHVPVSGPNESGSNMTHVYAVAKLTDGGVQFVVLTRAEVDSVRARSKASRNGPWVTDYEAMAAKTAIKRLVKYLPMSVELATAVEKDDVNDQLEELKVVLPDEDVEPEAPATRTSELKAKVLKKPVEEDSVDEEPEGDDLAPPEEVAEEIQSSKNTESSAISGLGRDTIKEAADGINEKLGRDDLLGRLHDVNEVMNKKVMESVFEAMGEKVRPISKDPKAIVKFIKTAAELYCG